MISPLLANPFWFFCYICEYIKVCRRRGLGRPWAGRDHPGAPVAGAGGPIGAQTLDEFVGPAGPWISSSSRSPGARTSSISPGNRGQQVGPHPDFPWKSRSRHRQLVEFLGKEGRMHLQLGSLLGKKRRTSARQGQRPNRLVTDKPSSYRAAHREVIPRKGGQPVDDGLKVATPRTWLTPAGSH